jgi:hypothetical protein
VRVIDRPTPNTAVVWGLAALLALVFVAFQIQSSFHSGSLALPPTYDDLNYFNDAWPRMELLYRDGGYAFLKQLIVRPPHSPVQTLLAIGGFALLGARPWAAYAMNVIPLILLLRVLLGISLRFMSLVSAGILSVALLGFPLVGLMVLDFRPDMLCALLTATGVLVIVADPRWIDGDRKTFWLVAVLFAGALLTKPTLAPVTMVVFLTAATCTTWSRGAGVHGIRKLAWRGLRCGLIGGTIVLPYYVLALPRLIEYINVNAFGKQAEIWRHQYRAIDNALYYITGPGGQFALGRGWLAMTCLAILVSLPWLIRHRRVASAGLVVFLVAYASVTVPAMKSPYLGLIVPALLLGIVAVVAMLTLQRLPFRWRWLGAFCLLIFSMTAWRPVAVRQWHEAPSITMIQHYNRIFTAMVDAVAEQPDLGHRQLYFPLIAQYMNQDNLTFELRRRGLPAPSIPELYFNRNLADHEAALRAADLVVLFSDDCELPIPWPASYTIRQDITARVVASDSFEPVARIDAGPYKGGIVIYRRKAI